MTVYINKTKQVLTSLKRPEQERQRDRERQNDRDRQTERQTGRHTHTHKHTHPHPNKHTHTPHILYQDYDLHVDKIETNFLATFNFLNTTVM